MAVASADASGAPSVRMVLLKGYDERGFVFYSNYGSRKARELANGKASMCFYWEPLQQQVSLHCGKTFICITDATCSTIRQPACWEELHHCLSGGLAFFLC